MQKAEAADELPLVMGEIKTVMAARGTTLTLHPDDGERPSVIYADAEGNLSSALIETLLVDHIGWTEADQPDAYRWVVCRVDDHCNDILLIPVQTIPGHSRLLIGVYFDHLTDERRREAERIYKQRKPFAIGYFRLWQLSRTRRREREALRAALNLTEVGIILLDRSARLTFANHAAREILIDGNGLRLWRDMVRASHLRDSVRLQVALEHVIASNGTRVDGAQQDRHAPLLSLERTQGPPLIVSVLPTEERATEPTDVAAILYVLDPGRDVQQMLRPICRIYNLSPVETRLTCLLVGGATLADAAGKMRVKEMTARSYLKQIFIKTNTHRQVELMQLMLSSVIPTSSHIVAEPLETI